MPSFPQDLMQQLEARYPLDFREHIATRNENDQRLLPITEEISSGENVENLERFAKAYLGMFLDMDNSVKAEDRLHILANPPLARAIYDGFEAILNKQDFFTPQQIAKSIHAQHFAEGYILLAALGLFANNPRYNVTQLSKPVVTAALCYHFAYKTEITDDWLQSVYTQRASEVVVALNAFWLQLIEDKSDHLPGLYQIIAQPRHDAIAEKIILPVLQNWGSVRKKVLRDLLRCALRTSEHSQLYRVVQNALTSWNAAEPSRYMLWLATAYLLKPAQHQQQINDYTSRSKEKIIPLLDFVFWVLHTDGLTNLTLDAEAYANLIRVIAAKITPQKDRYNELCANTRKVMFLFFCLANATDKQAAISALAKVRVMKLYDPILEFITDWDANMPQHTLIEQHERFLDELKKRELIRPRVKWFD